MPETLRPSSSTFTFKGIPNLKALRQKLADGQTPVVLVLDDLLSDIESLPRDLEEEFSSLIYDYSRKQNIS